MQALGGGYTAANLPPDAPNLPDAARTTAQNNR